MCNLLDDFTSGRAARRAMSSSASPQVEGTTGTRRQREHADDDDGDFPQHNNNNNKRLKKAFETAPCSETAVLDPSLAALADIYSAAADDDNNISKKRADALSLPPHPPQLPPPPDAATAGGLVVKKLDATALTKQRTTTKPRGTLGAYEIATTNRTHVRVSDGDAFPPPQRQQSQQQQQPLWHDAPTDGEDEDDVLLLPSGTQLDAMAAVDTTRLSHQQLARAAAATALGGKAEATLVYNMVRGSERAREAKEGGRPRREGGMFWFVRRGGRGGGSVASESSSFLFLSLALRLSLALPLKQPR